MSRNTTGCFHIRHFADSRRTRCTLMKRRVNYPRCIERESLSSRHTSIHHARSGECVNRTSSTGVASPSALPLAERGGSHFYTRSIRGTSGAGARDDSREEQRSLRHGSQTRPGTSTRLLLQLDDLVVRTYTVAGCVPAAAMCV